MEAAEVMKRGRAIWMRASSMGKVERSVWRFLVRGKARRLAWRR